jgi:hypothetical protein
MSLCEPLFSTWLPVSCGKCSQLQSRLLHERMGACGILANERSGSQELLQANDAAMMIST